MDGAVCAETKPAGSSACWTPLKWSNDDVISVPPTSGGSAAVGRVCLSMCDDFGDWTGGEEEDEGGVVQVSVPLTDGLNRDTAAVLSRTCSPPRCFTSFLNLLRRFWNQIFTCKREYRSSSSVITMMIVTIEYIFTALNGMQTRYSDENYVCPSVSLCLSVSQTRKLWQNGRKISPDFLYYMKEHLA